MAAGEQVVYTLMDATAAHLPDDHVRLLADVHLTPSQVLEEIAALATSALRHPQRTLIVFVSGLVGLYPDDDGQGDKVCQCCYAFFK